MSLRKECGGKLKTRKLPFLGGNQGDDGKNVAVYASANGIALFRRCLGQLWFRAIAKEIPLISLLDETQFIVVFTSVWGGEARRNDIKVDALNDGCNEIRTDKKNTFCVLFSS